MKRAILVERDERRFAQIAVGDLARERAREARVIERDGGEIVREVARHRADFADDALLVLLDIGLGDAIRVDEHHPRLVREPELHPVLEQDRGEDHDEQRRHGGDHRKQRDKPDVKTPPPAHAGAACPSQRDPAREQDEQAHQRHEVDDEQERHDRRRQQVLRGALVGEREIGRRDDADRGEQRRKLDEPHRGATAPGESQAAQQAGAPG